MAGCLLLNYRRDMMQSSGKKIKLQGTERKTKHRTQSCLPPKIIINRFVAYFCERMKSIMSLVSSSYIKNEMITEKRTLGNKNFILSFLKRSIIQ